MSQKASSAKRPKRVGVVANLSMDRAIKASGEALAILDGAGDIEVFVEKRLAQALKRKGGVSQTALDVDILIVAGGDGTILHTLHITSAPVLAINTGVVGFLAELTANEIERGMKRLLDGDFELEERMRISCSVNGRKTLDATNEVVVHTAAISKMMRLDLAIDGNHIDSVRADGLIVATPTGSTSYALSTGGPILDPRVRAMVITPIAPFNLHSRPMVVPADCQVQIATVDDRHPGLVVIDGQHEVHFRQSTLVDLTASDTPAYFVRMEGSFYDQLRRKFLSHYPCDESEA